MASIKQQIANVENAKRGGVKTEAGKSISRLNAISHGLLSQEFLLKTEKIEKLESMRSNFISCFSPEGALEELLVDLIVSDVWRLKRMMNVEKELFDSSSMASSLLGFDDSNKIVTDMAQKDPSDKILRYGTSIERNLFRALHELERVQLRRQGQPVSSPQVVDIAIHQDSKNQNGFVS